MDTNPGTSKMDESSVLMQSLVSSGPNVKEEHIELKVISKTRMKKKAHSNNKEKLKYKSGLLRLFRFATKFDAFLIFVGLLFSIVHGASFPILALVFGQMTNAFLAHEASNRAANQSVGDMSARFSIFPATHLQSSNSQTSSSASASPADERQAQFLMYLEFYSLNYLYIGIMVLFAAYIQTLCWEMACERQVHRLRQKAFSQILRQDISWYDTRQQSHLANILSDDVERIREGIGCKFSMVTQYLSTFVSGTIVGVVVNWRLTSVLLLIAPVLIGASAYLARLTAGSAAREQIKYGLAGGVAEEVLTNLRTVAAFSTEKKEVERYEQALELGRRLAMHKYKVLAWGLTVVFFLMYAQYGLAFYYGAVLFTNGYCSAGSIFTVFFSVLSGAFTLGNALPYVNAVATAFGSALSVFNVVDRVPPIDPYNNTGTKPPSLRGHIQLHNVYFSYPSRPDVQVLQGLSLEIQPGQTVALVGPSGSGKSTVIQLLLRFYDPTSGQVLIDEQPVQELSLSWLRGQLGMVSQEPVLFGVSIAENIRYGRPSATQDDIEMAATMANAHAFIDELPQGYETVLGERGAQLSGGQKQRVALARALVSEPSVLLLDEATSALDTDSERVVHEALQRAMLGRTTLIIAHRLSTVRNADLICAIENGRVVEQGNHDQLMRRRGLYYHLVNTQAVFEQEIVAVQDWDIPQNVGVAFTFQPYNWMSSLYSYTPIVTGAEIDPQGALPRHSLNMYAHSHDPLRHSFPDGEGRQVSMWMLVKLNRPEYGWLLLGLLGCTMSGSIMPVFAFFYGEVFSTFTKHGDELMKATVFWSCMFLVLGLLAAISIWLEVVTMTIAVEKLVMRLRVMAFRNILRQPIGWFDLDDHSSGRLITRLSRDAPLIKGAAGLRLGQLLGSLVTLVTALTIAVVYGWQLALVLMLVVPLISAGAFHQTRMVRNTQQRDARHMDDAGRVASECIQNIKTVQSLASESLFIRLYADYLVVPFRESKKQAFVYSSIFAVSQAVVYVMYAGAFRFGVYLIDKEVMTSSDVYRVFFALAFCAASVGTSSAYVQDYTKAKMAATQMFQLINRQSEIDALSPLGLKPKIKGELSFNAVSFHYPSRPDVQVLRRLQLTVASGQTLAVVGQSGCGKSTLVALLQRFYNPTSGTITVDGTDIQLINVHHLRRHIGLVTQEPLLFNQSIRDNIAYGLADDTDTTADLQARVEQAAVLANCHGFISQLPEGYDTRVGEQGCQLSGGQKQRIAIARALVRDPKILLLDEATSALDVESEKHVQEALDRAREGRTCIVIAHRLSTVQTADVIAVLDQGRVREMGTHQELKNMQRLYYQLMSTQT